MSWCNHLRDGAFYHLAWNCINQQPLGEFGVPLPLRSLHSDRGSGGSDPDRRCPQLLCRTRWSDASQRLWLCHGAFLFCSWCYEGNGRETTDVLPSGPWFRRTLPGRPLLLSCLDGGLFHAERSEDDTQRSDVVFFPRQRTLPLDRYDLHRHLCSYRRPL